MFCNQCGRQLDDRAAVCPACGAKTENAAYFGGFWDLVGQRPAKTTAALTSAQPPQKRKNGFRVLCVALAILLTAAICLMLYWMHQARSWEEQYNQMSEQYNQLVQSGPAQPVYPVVPVPGLPEDQPMALPSDGTGSGTENWSEGGTEDWSSPADPQSEHYEESQG